MTPHTPTDHASTLAKLDELLGTYCPFADSDYIRERMACAYERRLTKIGTSTPAAAVLVRALRAADRDSRYGVIEDTALRCTVQQSYRRHVTGEAYGVPADVAEQIFASATQHLARGERSGLLEAGVDHVVPVVPGFPSGWIWTEDRRDDVFARAFRWVVSENYGESLLTPGPDDIAMLQLGARLLCELVPVTARAALTHAHIVALFPAVGRWKGKASSSQFRISGTVFLNRDALRNPWWVAEHLLHEALHQKLYDFRHGHSLLTRDTRDYADEEEARRVLSIWNFPGTDQLNQWDAHRAVAAFHVYVHLSLLCTVAEARAAELSGDFGPLDGPAPVMTSARKALDRAHFLREQICEHCSTDLGIAGHALTDWLGEVLDALDPAPPPQGAYVHLLLDRYLLEVRAVQRKPSSADFDRALAEVTEEETRRARAVLLAIDSASNLSSFDSALLALEAATPRERFTHVRATVADALRNASPDGYRFASAGAPQTPDEQFRIMVEASSRALAECGAVP